MKKKLPPYGKQLKNKLQSGYYPTNGINIYTSWALCKSYRDGGRDHILVFPPDAFPDDFDWSFLIGQQISLINTEGYADYEKLKALAVLLVKTGVKRVGLIDVDHPLQWFVPEVKGIAA